MTKRLLGFYIALVVAQAAFAGDTTFYYVSTDSVISDARDAVLNNLRNEGIKLVPFSEMGSNSGLVLEFNGDGGKSQTTQGNSLGGAAVSITTVYVCSLPNNRLMYQYITDRVVAAWGLGDGVNNLGRDIGDGLNKSLLQVLQVTSDRLSIKIEYCRILKTALEHNQTTHKAKKL